MKVKAYIPNLTLKTHDESRYSWMDVQWKHERIKRNKRLSFKCKMGAMLASDNRPGKVWA